MRTCGGGQVGGVVGVWGSLLRVGRGIVGCWTWVVFWGCGCGDIVVGVFCEVGDVGDNRGWFSRPCGHGGRSILAEPVRYWSRGVNEVEEE